MIICSHYVIKDVRLCRIDCAGLYVNLRLCNSPVWKKCENVYVNSSFILKWYQTNNRKSLLVRFHTVRNVYDELRKSKYSCLDKRYNVTHQGPKWGWWCNQKIFINKLVHRVFTVVEQRQKKRDARARAREIDLHTRVRVYHSQPVSAASVLIFFYFQASGQETKCVVFIQRVVNYESACCFWGQVASIHSIEHKGCSCIVAVLNSQNSDRYVINYCTIR